jgi:hypothetical protein
MKLTESDIKKLRDEGRLLMNEFVVQEGDLFLAVNPATGTKRILDVSGILLEGNRKLLLD